MTKIRVLDQAQHSSSLHNPIFLIMAIEGGFYDARKQWPHIQVCWDASVFYSLRQHLLCVIAPSPTRFTPYISPLHISLISTAHSLPPSLSLIFSLSLPPLSLCLPPYIHIPPCFHPSLSHPPQQLACGSFEQLSLEGTAMAALPLYSLFPSDTGFCCCPALLRDWDKPPIASSQAQWQHVFPPCCWLSLCVR